jgi:hypothetical protein
MNIGGSPQGLSLFFSRISCLGEVGQRAGDGDGGQGKKEGGMGIFVSLWL